MRFAFIALLCVAANAQPWRTTLMGYPATPTSANIADIQRLESNVRLASPYFGRMTAADYAANRILMRNMVSYLGAADLMARDPQTRAAIASAYYYLAALRWVYPGAHAGVAPPPPPPGKPGEPPFEKSPPEIKDIAAADKETASDLRTRYATTAATASRAWTNAEQVRLNQEAQGFTMNAQTATAVARLQLYLELAAGALRDRDWNEAKENLEKTEYETEKVFRAVGR